MKALFIALILVVLATFSQAEEITANGKYFGEARMASVNEFMSEVQGEKDVSKVIAKVNTFVNEFTYTSDKAQYGKSDFWATSEEFFQNGGGDCEDFAIAKKDLLKKLGVNSTKMQILRVEGVLHARLLVELDGKILVLDNMNRLVQEATELQNSKIVGEEYITQRVVKSHS
jgi:predicted transglutaminase-like cysteine proteinase